MLRPAMKSCLLTMAAFVCLAACSARAGVIGGNVGLTGGARWDAAARTQGGNERSLQGGLRFSIAGGDYQAFRDSFTWNTVPTIAEFQQAILDAFAAWESVDPVSGLGTDLRFVEDLSTTTVGTGVFGGVNDDGAEIDLFALDAGDSGTRAIAAIRTISDPVTLTSGTVDYAGTSAIIGSDISINNNAGAVYSLDLFRRILTHEIGHSLGLGDLEDADGAAIFIDDDYDGTSDATALATLTNSWANLVNPLDPASSPLNLYQVSAATGTPGIRTTGVDILMESIGGGQGPTNPLSELVPLRNDDYGTRQFLYPFIAPAGNTAPVAVDDAYQVTSGQTLNITAPGVIGNDTDADGDTLMAMLGTNVSSGTLNLNLDGSFTYSPNGGFTGTDTFTYTVSDGNDTSNTATVTITVNAANTPPVAVDDAYQVTTGQTLNVAAPGVIGNDTDADGDTLMASLGTNVGSGTLNLNADGSFDYSPNGGFTGTDTFTYTVSDGADTSNIATVTITVNAAANNPPVAVDDSYTIQAGQILSEPAPGVLGNDTDAESDPLTAVLVSSPSSAMNFALNADGSFMYEPLGGFTGTDSFTYTADDGASSNVATVTITVTAVANNPPVASDDSYSIPAGQTLTVPTPGIFANDTDADGDALTLDMLVSNPPVASTQSFALQLDGSFSYTPVAGFAGVATFSYTASDGTDASNTATVTITVTPVTNAQDCIDQVTALADAYQLFADSTVAQANADILMLQQAGDFSGAIARNTQARTTLTQEAGVVSQDIMTICATCIADLQAQGQTAQVLQVQTACMAQSQRVGTIQATAISQLEGITLPPASGRPSRAALALRDRHLQAIRQAFSAETTAIDRFADRYVKIVHRYTIRGNATAAASAEAMAQQVIQQSTAARIARIQQLADAYQARFAADPNVQSLVAQVAFNAAQAIAQIQQAEARALAKIQAA